MLAVPWVPAGGLHAQEPQAVEASPPSDAVREAGVLLTALGYEPGPTDDLTWHEGLSRAYDAFLRDVGLPASKVLTPRGLRRLREVARSEGVASAGASAETAPDPAPERLHRAVIAGDIEGVRELLSNGAPVDDRDSQGWTALMHAANKGYVLLVDILLRSGASPDIRAADGATALFIATMNAHPEAIALLMRAGASVSTRGPRGLTAVDVARLVYGEKKEQRPVPDDAEVQALLAGMTWAEAIKEAVAGLKAKQQAAPSVSRQQQGVEPRDAEQEVSSPAPSTGDAEAVDAALALTHAQRVSVQKALSELGFKVGSADGLFGRRTRAAIRRYQGEEGLEQTGYLNAEEAQALIALGEESARREQDREEAERGADDEFKPKEDEDTVSGTDPTHNAHSTRLKAELLAADCAFWASIRRSENPADFQAYLKKYPQGEYVYLACNRLKLFRTAPVNATDIVTCDIHTENERLSSLVATAGRVLEENRALNEELRVRLTNNEAEAGEIDAQRRKVQSNVEVLDGVIANLNEKRSQYTKVAGNLDDEGEDTAALRKQVRKMSEQIDLLVEYRIALEEELDVWRRTPKSAARRARKGRRAPASPRGARAGEGARGSR